MTTPIQTCDDCGLPIPVCNMNAVIRRAVEACGPDALKASPEVQALVAEAVERKDEALHRIVEWAGAYPPSVFPEPDFAKAAKVLADAGLSLDAIAASSMRHVVNGVREIAAAAIRAGKGE